MTLNERAFSSTAPWLWAGLCFVAWFASLFVALPLAGPIGSIVNVAGPGEPLRWELAVFLAIDGLLSMAAALVIGRRIFGRGLVARPVDLVMPLIGVALAIAVELALHAWAEARFGYYDNELVWWTAGLAAMLVITAIATFGVQIAPAGAAIAPRTCTVIAALLVWLIVVSNAAGLRDGVDPESWPLAILVGLSAAYAAVAVALPWIGDGR